MLQSDRGVILYSKCLDVEKIENNFESIIYEILSFNLLKSLAKTKLQYWNQIAGIMMI